MIKMLSIWSVAIFTALTIIKTPISVDSEVKPEVEPKVEVKVGAEDETEAVVENTKDTVTEVYEIEYVDFSTRKSNTTGKYKTSSHASEIFGEYSIGANTVNNVESSDVYEKEIISCSSFEILPSGIIKYVDLDDKEGYLKALQFTIKEASVKVEIYE